MDEKTVSSFAAAVNIKINPGFEAAAAEDYETEYWLAFALSGTIEGFIFKMGNGDEDVHIFGAEKFKSPLALLERMFETEHFVVDAAVKDKLREIAAKLNVSIDAELADQEKLFDFVKDILWHRLKNDAGLYKQIEAKMAAFMKDCNDTAAGRQSSWDSE